MLNAIVSIVGPDLSQSGYTIKDLLSLRDELQMMHADPDLNLVGAPTFAVLGLSSLTSAEALTVRDFLTWVATLDSEAHDTPVTGLEEFCVDLETRDVTPAPCEDHGETNVNVTLGFTCARSRSTNPLPERTSETITLIGGQKLTRVHSAQLCVGQRCPIHNISPHHMNAFPQSFRVDAGFMERICPHGVGHPDPDDRFAPTIHGCDGCCMAGPSV